MSQANEFNPHGHLIPNNLIRRDGWTEDMAKHGIAWRNYPDKWSKAQELCKRVEYFMGGWAAYSYWERVHFVFLELGGCRVDQLLPYQQRAYDVAPAQLTTGDGVVLGTVTSVSVTLSDAEAFGGTDELKAHLHQFWAAELAHALLKAGL